MQVSPTLPVHASRAGPKVPLAVGRRCRPTTNASVKQRELALARARSQDAPHEGALGTTAPLPVDGQNQRRTLWTVNTAVESSNLPLTHGRGSCESHPVRDECVPTSAPAAPACRQQARQPRHRRERLSGRSSHRRLLPRSHRQLLLPPFRVAALDQLVGPAESLKKDVPRRCGSSTYGRLLPTTRRLTHCLCLLAHVL
jgi:hypothetical protein